MAQPEQPDTSSHQSTVGVKQLYKSLLNQHAQKIWKQLPVYQTFNEGSDHSPKFRCTVWVDGVAYTSSNSFTQRKMAEMDASRIAFFGSLQKLKNEASRLVLENRSVCKSALVEYAIKMNISKPTYQTMQLETSIPVFRSSLVVDGFSCTGENSRSKKEAERSAARAAVLKCLDLESGGHIMSEIINCKFKHSTDSKELQSTQNDSSKVVPTGGEKALIMNKTTVEEVTNMPFPTGVENVFPSPTGVENSLTLNETKVDEGTNLPSSTSGENVLTLNKTEVDEGTNLPSLTNGENAFNLNKTKVEERTKMPSPIGVKNGLTLNEIKVEESTKMPSPTGVENGVTLNETKVEEETKVLSTDICSVQNATSPAMHLYSSLPRSNTQKVSTQALKTATTVHTVLPKIPSAGTHYVPTSFVKSALPMAVNPPPNVVQVVKSEESSLTAASPLSLASPAIKQTTAASTTRGKKRNLNDRKMAEKKMCVENQQVLVANAYRTSESSSFIFGSLSDSKLLFLRTMNQIRSLWNMYDDHCRNHYHPLVAHDRPLFSM